VPDPKTDPYDSEETQNEHIRYPNPAIEVIELYGRLRALRRALADIRHSYAVLAAACRATLSGFSFEGGDVYVTDAENQPLDNCEVTEHEFNPYPNPAVEAATLGAQLGAFRRAYANLVAACRAALLAQRDGEADPWAYLRDELPEPPPGHPLHPDHDDQAHSSAARGGR